MPDTLSLDCDFADRFVYWRGASGRRYIHTVYETGDCPPLPGAIYVSVARDGRGHCQVLAVGRFPVHLAFNLARAADGGAGIGLANEIHVHLLADDEDERQMIVDDLRRGLDVAPQPQRADNVSQLQLFAA